MEGSGVEWNGVIGELNYMKGQYCDVHGKGRL